MIPTKPTQNKNMVNIQNITKQKNEIKHRRKKTVAMLKNMKR